MKKKLNYLILLLAAVFMAGCTDVEEAADADVETAVQEETAAEKEEARLAAEKEAAEKA